MVARFLIAWLFLLCLLIPGCVPLPDTVPAAIFQDVAEAMSLRPLLGFHVARGDAAHLRATQAAGGRFAVVVFSWRDIEPTPNYLYWEQPDAALRAAEFYDIAIVARLDRPPDWALSDDGPTPWRLDVYANFVRRVTARYGDRLDGVIIWNEPNLALEWNGAQPDPAGYVAMLRAAYPVVKEQTPALPVLMAGLAFTEGDGVTARNDLAYLRAVYDAGGGAYFDALAAHPYGFGRAPDDAPEPERLNFRRVELHRQIMAANGDRNKPVWITEMGWRTSAPDPDDVWQVVTPVQQAEYSLDALHYAAEHYPWIERMAFWELNSRVDQYGYALWQGAGDAARAYDVLAAHARNEERPTTNDAERPTEGDSEHGVFSVEILAPDVIIRLGDVDTMHPHWVHLHRGGQNFSPDWVGEFFLTAEQAQQPHEVLLETMQIDQPTNRIAVNDVDIGALHARTRPDPTSTWITQRFRVSPEHLQAGVNTLKIRSGLRNPALQYRWWRWENFQFRHARLVPPQSAPQPVVEAWQPLPSPSGWAEINRVRRGQEHGGTATFWVTGNRPGQLWRGVQSRAATQGIDLGPLTTQAHNRSDLVFVDVVDTDAGQLVATDRGVFWRADENDRWQAVSGAPQGYAFVVAQSPTGYLAGFADAGLWQADAPAGPWRRAALTDHTVLDVVVDRRGVQYIATDRGIYSRSWMRLHRLPEGETGADFPSRLSLGAQDELLARRGDQFWRWEATGGWRAVAPALADHQQRVLLDCCAADTLLGLNAIGLHRPQADGAWLRVDGGFFTDLMPADALLLDGVRYVATKSGLFYAADTDGDPGEDPAPNAGEWRKVEGLPATISDLLVDPQDPQRWLAGTPAGLYRSEDGGATWHRVSPPWEVWDMAFGLDGRLFLALDNGVAWSDDAAEPEITWRKADGLESVIFFSVNPSPFDAAHVWGGTWGNNVGVSQDGGVSMESLHNGLETLSALDVLWHPTPGQFTLATIEGLYRSDDGGQSWFKLPGVLQQQTVYSLLQTEDGAIWAGAADGLWRSVDYGVTWQRIAELPITTVVRLGQLTVPDGARWLWAGTEQDGVWLSRDGGFTWQFGGLAGRSVFQLLFDPMEAGRLVAATDGGVFGVDGL